MFTDFRLPTPRTMKDAMKKRVERPLSVRAMSGASVALFALTFSPLLAPPQPHELRELGAFLTGSESIAATLQPSSIETAEQTSDVIISTSRPEGRVQEVSARIDAPLEDETLAQDADVHGAEADEVAAAENESIEPAPIEVEAEVLEELPAPAEAEAETEEVAVEEDEALKS